MLTYEEVNRLLDYNPETGELRWKVSRGRVLAGGVAGSPHTVGYISIRINKKLHLAHRIAWLLHYGIWPINQIDHINMIKNDNRIVNLREATHAENKRNQGAHSNNPCGLKGVCFHKQVGKWQAQCYDRTGKYRYLGLYTTPEAAHEAYKRFAQIEHLEFYNPGDVKYLTSSDINDIVTP